jgi:arylsulfatase B
MIKKILFFAFTSLFALQIQAQRNVILIIADDLGTDYCGFYENHLDTAAMPNIRKLLKKGVRFSRAWSNPLCSPTRSGILTGRYSFRTGVGDAVGGVNSAVLDTAETTIPRLLNKFKPNGIAKANIGKWHLQLAMPNTNYTFPNKMGYDHFEGNFLGVLNSFTNWTKVKNGKASTITNYATTETVDNAISWINTQQNKPFFLWLAFNAPHSPFHLPPTALHSYKNLSGTAADITANPKPYFKAAVEALDTEVGRLFSYLQSINQFENTDIIFIGDNGNDSAVAQNTGGAKGSIYQEGVSVPFIISGPSVVNPNRVSDALVNTHDLFATILELFGHTTWQSQILSNKPVDSKSILPILKNTATTIRPWIFTEVFKIPTVAGDGKAMRNDEYKLLDFDNGTQKFFNLKNDPTENNDLLKKTLVGAELTNYTYLCNEMSKLVGKGSFCNIIATEDIDNQINKIKIHPNPFENFIKIENAQGDETYELSNNLGQVFFKGKNIETQDFSPLAKGVYFLKIENSRVVKMVKE